MEGRGGYTENSGAAVHPEAEESGSLGKSGGAMEESSRGTGRQLLTSTLAKRKRSSLFNDGVEEGGFAAGESDEHGTNEDDLKHDMTEASIEPLLPSTRGGLQHRRANVSSEKLNTGRSGPLTIDTSQDRPLKKRRVEANVEIAYDAAGTPRLSPLPSSIQAQQSNDAGFLASRRKNSASSASTSDSITFEELINLPFMNLQDAPRQRKFSLIHSICRDNAILMHFVSFLNLPSLISLYAISKPFHYLFNRHHTAFILSNMRTWAPNADRIYPWRCYKSLCVKDPSKLRKARLEGEEDEVTKKWNDLRDVPSLRWLQMVVWREGVCRDMLVQLATNGLRLPWGTLESVKKTWFIMDLPLNSQRIALIHNPDYFPKGVLLGMTFFLIKVDMHFTDPLVPTYEANHRNQRMHPNKYAGGLPTGVPLRKMLLAERHLSSLWRVMRGWSWDSGFGKSSDRPLHRLDLLRLWIRHKYVLPETASDEVKKMSIMAIPWHEIGTAGFERTGVAFHDLTAPDTGAVLRTIPIVNPAITGLGLTDHQADQVLYPHRKRIILANEKPREMLLRPDDLLIREGIRRRLKMHKHWWKAVFYGFLDGMGRKIPVPTEEEVLRKLREGPKMSRRKK